MKPYQKAQKPVKESVKIPDEQALLETAAEGLLNFSVELGMQVVRRLLKAEKSFRRVKGYRQIPLLLGALSRELETPTQVHTKIA